MTSWGCRLLQVKWPACMRHQKKASIPAGMLKQRDLPSPSLMGRQEVAHQTSPPTVPELGSPEVLLRLHVREAQHTLWGHKSLGAMEFYHPPSDIQACTQTAKFCSCLASSGPWQSLRVTAFSSCSLASLAAVHPGQLVGDPKEVDKEGIRSAHSLPTSKTLLH